MKLSFDQSRFEFRNRLGRGGTADVIRVFAPHLQREAALKYPLESDTLPPEQFAHLAIREQKLIGSYSFPGLVRILEHERSGQYLLLELCPGPTLDSLGRIDDLGVACSLLSAIALDLEFLRVAGIIHGDFKPQNVFLPEDWLHINDGRLHWVKLSDFSLGRLTTEDESMRAGLGTIGFVAPETLADGTTSHLSDLFAFGVTAYTALSGSHPFLKDGADPVEVASRVRLDNPPPLASLRPDVSEELSDLIASLMAKDPEQRPKSGWDVCCRLRHLGARYPFERALQPKHLILRGMRVDALPGTVAKGSNADINRFLMLSANDEVSARLILTSNWRRGMIRYDAHGFRFTNGVSWPARLRRAKARDWRKMPLGGRKQTVKRAAAIAASDGRTFTGAEANSPAHLRAYLLSGLMSIPSLKRISRRLATETEESGNVSMAARLNLQAGNFADAQRCALIATKQFREKHLFAEAQALLHLCIDYGQMTRQSPSALGQLVLEHGEVHMEAGESELAEQAFHQITESNNPDEILVARAYNHLGDIYKAKRQFEPGAAALRKALAIFSRLGDDLKVSHVHNNLGNIYSITGDFRQALSHYRRALRVPRRLKLGREVASIVSNMGAIYFVLGRAMRGIRVMTLSLKLKRELGDKGEIARTLNNLGYANISQGNDRQALEQLTESLDLNRQIGNQKEILFNLDNLSQVMLRTGRLAQCLAHLKEGIRIAEELNDVSHQAAFTSQMGHVLLRMGRLADALKAADDATTQMTGSSDGDTVANLYRLRFELLHLVGKCDEAVTLARHAIAEPLIADLAPARLLLLVALARVGVTSPEEEELRSLAAQLKIQDFDITLAGEQIESAIAHGDLTRAQRNVDILSRAASDTSSQNIDTARRLLAIGEVKFAMGKTDEATANIQSASTLAQTTGLLPEMISASVLRAEILFARADYESCFQHCRKALDLSKQLLAGTEQSWQLSFQKTRRIQRLASMIGRLGTILAKKERAG